MHRKLFVTAYDVRDPRRLARALRVVRGYASGGQKSAYECWLLPAERQSLLRDMAAVIDLEQDSFAIIPLEPSRPLITLGQAVQPVDPQFFYFG